MAAGRIVIIGAGIGGLAAARALLRRGIDVEIHEQERRGLQSNPSRVR
jgi:2-polyprenyl-6-methoxyphenol hydroxylase-like FAD-dependent oxidoreductase